MIACQVTVRLPFGGGELQERPTRLKLSRETVRDLTEQDMQKVNGGGITNVANCIVVTNWVSCICVTHTVVCR